MAVLTRTMALWLSGLCLQGMTLRRYVPAQTVAKCAHDLKQSHLEKSHVHELPPNFIASFRRRAIHCKSPAVLIDNSKYTMSSLLRSQPACKSMRLVKDPTQKLILFRPGNSATKKLAVANIRQEEATHRGVGCRPLGIHLVGKVKRPDSKSLRTRKWRHHQRSIVWLCKRGPNKSTFQ